MPRKHHLPQRRPISRLIFINRYFFPDHSATSQILSDLAFHLADEGRSVHVIASRQLYDDADARLPAYEIVRGVTVHRVPSSRFGRKSLLGRALDYLSFYASAARKLRLSQKNDVVIAKTDPPLLSVLTWALSFRGYRRVNWLQDLYPEIAGELGVAGARGLLGRGLTMLRNRSLDNSVQVTVGHDMAARLGLGGARIIENWADDDEIAPINHTANPLRARWGLENKFVVAYSGNLGRAHDVQTILAAAERLRGNPDIVFLFVGGGHGIAEVEARAKSLGLGNFVFKPYQPREQLSHSLGAGDVHWLSLKTGFDGLVLPSKFYGIAAAGRPIIVIGSPDGELAQLVKAHDCGFAVAPGDGEELMRQILALAKNPVRPAQMGSNARTMLDANFSKARALRRWSELLDALSPIDR